ncbi:MAG: thermonuclease family protein [Proteobacteria bacterium]|nr:thermonuclease family protein [Pseudomonadota bacterium]
MPQNFDNRVTSALGFIQILAHVRISLISHKSVFIFIGILFFGFSSGYGVYECKACLCPPGSVDVETSSASKTSNEVASEAAGIEWFVLKVIDGDTLVVRHSISRRKERVRLLRIDTPEIDQPGFNEAREALKGLVRNGNISLEFEKPGVEDRDVFGRLLAYVVANRINANIEMVRLGWSPFWKKFGKGRLAAEFENAEREAKQSARGMWERK